MLKRLSGLSLIIVTLLVVLDLYAWYQIIFARTNFVPAAVFLDVGQGDGTLLEFPGNVKILTDAGPDQKVVRSLEKVLAVGDRYIDLAVITHAQLDHFNGFNYILDRYRIGAFIFNGRLDAFAKGEWDELMGKIKSQKIPLIRLSRGDQIRYRDNRIDILSPDHDWVQSGEPNDTGIVQLVTMPYLKILLTADTGMNVEDELQEKFGLRADVLKVGHHGSKFSSGDEFFKEVNPKLAVIEVGVNNRYGHPARETLARLASSTSAKTFRTDQNGTVSVFVGKSKLRVFTSK